MALVTRFLPLASALFIITSFGQSASALDLDWHGQFRAETNWLFGYSHGNLGQPAGNGDYGYFIPSNGDSPASFQNLFFRLDPRVIVNDNITVHADLWLGTPDRGMFGSDQKTTSTYYSTNTGNAAVTAHELYAEVATDFGTITVGRAPLNWGLGLIWNNDKTKFDRLPSTGDTVSLVTKLGAFRLMPGITKYRMGSNYGGTTGPAAAGYVGTNPTTVYGGSGATDYTVGLTYTNDDEQIDLGLLFMRRLAGPNAAIINPFAVDPYNPATNPAGNPVTAGYAYNVWDFYLKKQSGILTVAAEVPLVTGVVAGQTYSTVAGAVQGKAQLSEKWALKVNAGMANGQENIAPGGQAPKLTEFYFHPDYRPGFLMFNYNYRNLSNGALSPYDDPVTNARFFSFSIDDVAGKFTHTMNWVYAYADKTADGVAGNVYFNQTDGVYRTETTTTAAQSNQLGWEWDYSIAYDWDESIRLGLQTGVYFPGAFWLYNDSVGTNHIKTVFGSSLNLSVKF